MSNRPYVWTGEETHRYDDIISRPHPVSLRHPPMSGINRAAQFSPYAALVGYDDSVAEAARLTGEREGVFDDEREALNQTLFELGELCEKAAASQKSASPTPYPRVAVSYFVPDAKKDGGAYAQYADVLRRVDAVENVLLFKTGKRIPLADIGKIELVI